MSGAWRRPDLPENCEWAGYTASWAGNQSSSASTATGTSGKREASDLPLAYRKKARTSDEWYGNDGADLTSVGGFAAADSSTSAQGPYQNGRPQTPAQMMEMMSNQMWSIMSGFMGGAGSTEHPRADDDGWGSNQSLPIPGDGPGDGKRFTGRIKRSYEMTGGGGYGFIESNEAKMKYGRDVYIHAKQLAGFQIGDSVSFTIIKNAKGEPQARNVIRTEDAVILRAQQQQNQQMQELQLMQKQKNTSVPLASTGGVMTEEEAKKFQESLKRNRL